MSRYIDAYNLMKALEEDIPITDNPIEVMASVIATLEEQPTADVVEVVRCKDCEYGQSYNMFGSRYCIKHNDVAVKDNDFCNYGERAEE